MEAEGWLPGDLQPAAGVVVGAGKVGGNEEPFVLREELGLPVGGDGIGGVEESVGDGTAAG